MRPLDLDDAAQVAAVHRLVADDETSGVGFTDETPVSIRGRLTHPDAHAPAHRLAWRDDEPVGALLVELDRHGRDVFLDAYAPVPDRSEVLGELLLDGLASARAIAQDDPADGRDADGQPVRDPYLPTPGVWQVEAGSYGQDEGYATALTATGFAARRRFWRMRPKRPCRLGPFLFLPATRLWQSPHSSAKTSLPFFASPPACAATLASASRPVSRIVMDCLFITRTP